MVMRVLARRQDINNGFVHLTIERKDNIKSACGYSSIFNNYFHK